MESLRTSARNVLAGTVTAITKGLVHVEIEMTTLQGDVLFAIVTEESVTKLNLEVGHAVNALIKAPWIMLLAGPPSPCLSARNQLVGTVVNVGKGAVNSDVTLRLRCGSEVHAIITQEAVLALGLEPGNQATAVIKASHIVLAVAE